MIYIANTPEEALDKYWLCVWRNLIEEYWNWLRKPDEDNYPYYVSGKVWTKPHYTFASLRRDKCQSEESIDEDVAKLAVNFWKRNRSDLKEYFINWTCGSWNQELAIEKDLAGGWLDCGVDPCYPNRREQNNLKDAQHLSIIGVLQVLLAKAIHRADDDILKINMREILNKVKKDKAKIAEEKKQRRKARIDKAKKFVFGFFIKFFGFKSSRYLI